MLYLIGKVLPLITTLAALVKWLMLRLLLLVPPPTVLVAAEGTAEVVLEFVDVGPGLFTPPFGRPCALTDCNINEDERRTRIIIEDDTM